MGYLLDGTTLPKPVRMERIPREISSQNQTLDGQVKKDIITQKEDYRLYYSMLSQTDVLTITTIYDKQEAVTFSVSDGDLTISEIDVFVNIESRQYNTKGTEYREDLVLVLTEV